MHAAWEGAIATTNSEVAVLVLTLTAPALMSVADVSAALQGGAVGNVTDVQPFPNEPASYLIEVCALSLHIMHANVPAADQQG